MSSSQPWFDREAIGSLGDSLLSPHSETAFHLAYASACAYRDALRAALAQAVIRERQLEEASRRLRALQRQMRELLTGRRSRQADDDPADEG